METDAARLMALFETPPDARDAYWRDRLNAAFWPTRLGSFTPHVVQDQTTGLYAYRLGSDEQDGGEAALEPAGAVDWALSEGIGLVLWPSRSPQPQWIFRVGDLLSYRLYGTAFVPRFWNETDDHTGSERLDQGELWRLGEPSAQMFPPPVRDAVRRFMREKLGLAEPKVVLAQRPGHGARLVFDLDPAALGGEANVARAFAAVHWHIPSCIPIYRVDSLAGDASMRTF